MKTITSPLHVAISLRAILFILLLSTGCSTTDERVNIKGDLADVVSHTNGTEAYFLGTVPAWINFSSWARCERNESIRYMNFENISKSYNLNYNQIVHMQHKWNRKISTYRKSTGRARLALNDESFIFNNVHAQVVGGSLDFIVPKYNKVSVVWIDPYLKDQKKLTSIINRNDVQNGFPILLSNCLSSHEVEDLIKKLKLDEVGAKVLSAEMFSHFDSQLKKQPFFSLDLNQLLKGKKIILYGPRNPTEITGDFKFKLIK
jgi:hypothetical protein